MSEVDQMIEINIQKWQTLGSMFFIFFTLIMIFHDSKFPMLILYILHASRENDITTFYWQ